MASLNNEERLDRAQQRLKSQYAKKDEDDRREAIRALLGVPQGRILVWWLLRSFGWGFPIPLFDKELAFDAGVKHNLALEFIGEIEEAGLDLFPQLQKEMTHEHRRRDAEISGTGENRNDRRDFDNDGTGEG